MNTIWNDPKIFLLYLLIVFLSLPVELWAETGSGIVNPENDANNGVQVPLLPADLLKKADLSVKDKDKQVTADLYYEVHLQFPEAPEAENALWQSAALSEELARTGKKDWEAVRDLYREYISYHPGGEHIAPAYLGVGISLYYMNFRREALTYLNLSIKRFSEGVVPIKAKMHLAKVLADVGRIAEALEIYTEIAETGETTKVKLLALLGKAEILNSQQEYGAALAIYHDLAAKDPNFFREELEALRIFGKTNLFSGNVERGQNQLIHYLNLEEDSTNRSAVLFEIGESYWRQKKFQAAEKMFKRAIKEGDESQGPVIFSKMRVAQYLDDPNRPPEKWDRPHELTDSEGDVPYLIVLDLFYDDPFAQEARQGLFWRFRARGDVNNMLDYGKNYLRLTRMNGLLEDKQTVGEVFLALADTLLEKEKYQDLYDIYYSEYEYIKDYPNGRLLYLVGQAMDALALYDQAAVIYYRALKWPLSEEDKVNLYYKRANVYIIKGDHDSAERLLKYLRKIYRGQKKVGEAYSLSGRLREAQKKDREALGFYRKALEFMTFTDKKSEYVADVVRLALLLDGSEAIVEIEGYMKSGLVSGLDLQKMYALAGNALRLAGENQKAAELYTAALAAALPQEGKVFQSVNLYLGDCLLAVQKREVAVEHYQKAIQGEDSLLRNMAQERLNQNAIEMELSKLKNGGGS